MLSIVYVLLLGYQDNFVNAPYFKSSIFVIHILHFILYSPSKICFSVSFYPLTFIPRDKARHHCREESTAGVLGTVNAVGQSKNQAFVFRGDFSTAAGQFSHFVYGRS